jgi:DNA-binding protein YbaB
MTDIPHTEPWLDELYQQTARHLEQVSQLQDDLSSLYAEAHTAEGRVRVRVNAAGRPTALTLEPTATSMPAPALAAAILRAVDDAAAQASERLAALVESLVPPAELDAMLAGRPTEADRVAVRNELDALRPDQR